MDEELIAYLDDILVYGETLEEVKQHDVASSDCMNWD
jgi:hypothetical protein